MDILKNLVCLYIYAGFIFLALVSLIAIIKKNTKIFEFGLLYIIVVVLLWPKFIISLFRG